MSRLEALARALCAELEAGVRFRPLPGDVIDPLLLPDPWTRLPWTVRRPMPDVVAEQVGSGLEVEDGWVVVQTTRIDSLGPAFGVFRGIVIWQGDGTVEFEVDDGRGIVEAGAARWATVADDIWRVVGRLLVSPVALLLDVLKAAAEDKGTLEVSAMSAFAPVAVITLNGVRASIERGRCSLEFEDGGGALTTVKVRQMMPARDLACGIAASMLDLVDQLDGTAPPRGDVAPAFLPPSRARLAWSLAPRPDATPAALRDAVAGPVTRSEVVDDWQSRVKALVAAESDADRTARRAVQGKRPPMVWLPPLAPADRRAEVDATGQVMRWGSRQGAARLPVPSGVIVALWACGFTVRTVSELLVGSQAAKSAVNRRVQEATRGGELLVEVAASFAIERAGLSWASAVQEPALEAARTGEEPAASEGDGGLASVASSHPDLPSVAHRLVALVSGRGRVLAADVVRELGIGEPRSLNILISRLTDAGQPIDVERRPEGLVLRWFGARPTADLEPCGTASTAPRAEGAEPTAPAPTSETRRGIRVRRRVAERPTPAGHPEGTPDTAARARVVPSELLSALEDRPESEARFVRLVAERGTVTVDEAAAALYITPERVFAIATAIDRVADRKTAPVPYALCSSTGSPLFWKWNERYTTTAGDEDGG